MAGMQEQLAAILYPDTYSSNPWVYGGKALMQTRTPQFEDPWMTGLTQALTGLAGGAITGLGMRQARGQQMAQTRDAMQYLGDVDPKVKDMLTSENEVANKLGMALLGRGMDSKSAAEKLKAERDEFEFQKGVEFNNQRKLKEMELSAEALKRDTQAAKEMTEADLKKWQGGLDLNSKLSDDKEYTAYSQALKSYKDLRDVIKQDNVMGDISAVKAFERTQNPGSVISPGEFNTINEAVPFIRRLIPGLNAYVTGEGRLTPEVRQQMLELAKPTVKNAGEMYNDRLAALGPIAKQLKLEEQYYAPVPRFSEDVFLEAPAGPAAMMDIINQAAKTEGVDPKLLSAVVELESSFNPNAVGTLTKSGERAQGAAQLMPGTAKELGVRDPLNAEQSVGGGAKYLKQNLVKYGGDIVKAAAAYNAGPGNVDKYGGLPPFPETQAYVARILEATGSPVPPGYALVKDPETGKKLLMTMEQLRKANGS